MWKRSFRASLLFLVRLLCYEVSLLWNFFAMRSLCYEIFLLWDVFAMRSLCDEISLLCDLFAVRLLCGETSLLWGFNDFQRSVTWKLDCQIQTSFDQVFLRHFVPISDNYFCLHRVHSRETCVKTSGGKTSGASICMGSCRPACRYIHISHHFPSFPIISGQNALSVSIGAFTRTPGVHLEEKSKAKAKKDWGKNNKRAESFQIRKNKKLLLNPWPLFTSKCSFQELAKGTPTTTVDCEW